jgi:hypothetical protein
MLKLFPVFILAFIFASDCGKKRPQPQPPRPAPTVQPTPIEPSPEPTVSPSPVESPSPSPTSPSPEASPTPSPAASPARVKPTPYPVPAVDLTPYLKEQGGKIVDITIQPGEDVGLILNKVDAQFEGPGKIILRGGGEYKNPDRHLA